MSSTGLDDLPRIDEHSVDVAATPEAVFAAVRQRFDHLLSGPAGRVFARVWGCDPPNAFAVVDEQPPHLLVVAGQHRFSRYGIVFRISAAAGGSKLSAESRAEFPGWSGRAYRTVVIGSGGHVVATRTLLRRIAASAERRHQ